WTRAAESVAKRGARWRLVGNAVSVPAAEWIGRNMKKPRALQRFDTAPMRGHQVWPSAAWNVGTGRHTVAASECAVLKDSPSLQHFLRHAAAPLSAKATRGFLSRTRTAKLRFQDGFIEAVERHLEAVSR